MGAVVVATSNRPPKDLCAAEEGNPHLVDSDGGYIYMFLSHIQEPIAWGKVVEWLHSLFRENECGVGCWFYSLVGIWENTFRTRTRREMAVIDPFD